MAVGTGDLQVEKKKPTALMLIAAIAVLFTFVYSMLAGSDTDSSSTTVPAQVEVERYVALNPATIRVFMDVSRSGECTIRATDPSGTYSGFDILTFDKTGLYKGDIVIENEGAAFVTSVEADCS